MKKLFNFLGSGFVYRSPKPHEGFARFLLDLQSRELISLAESKAHCSKKKISTTLFTKKCPHRNTRSMIKLIRKEAA